MATYSVYIPLSAFDANKPLFGKDKQSATVTVPLITQVGAPGLKVQFGHPQSFEDFAFQPSCNQHYQEILQMVNSGLIEIATGGSAQTPQQLITLFKSFYQEL